jgi:hypothetical protein
MEGSSGTRARSVTVAASLLHVAAIVCCRVVSSNACSTYQRTEGRGLVGPVALSVAHAPSCWRPRAKQATLASHAARSCALGCGRVLAFINATPDLHHSSVPSGQPSRGRWQTHCIRLCAGRCRIVNSWPDAEKEWRDEVEVGATLAPHIRPSHSLGKPSSLGADS